MPLIVLLFCFTGIFGCRGTSDPGRAFKQVDWEFIESVGGMSVGEPYIDRASNFLIIPIVQDFSGRKKITVDPTLKSSGLGCAQIAGSSVRFNALVGATEILIVAWAGAEATVSPGICNEVSINLNLPTLPISKVRVAYRDPGFRHFYRTHFMGSFSL